jgi:DNA-binding NarL/FixJ family response regulator
MTAAKLSTRELEVLRLLGQGFSNLNIAEQLDLSPKTVATYRARIGEKLGLRTTAEFVKYAVDTGMIGPQLK